ncbi:MAG: hypothetical protein HKM24_07780 [Gammaproteobacteria bacterium]|nr:hypothetical protein [Gammaproteobacteria bacterium]
MFKKLRISILLYLLIIVALGAWLSWQRTTDWQEPLWVTVFPINADGSVVVDRYISTIAEKQFEDIERFMAREASRHGIEIDAPVTMRLASPVIEQPPMPPTDGSRLKTAWWSGKLRLWANRVSKKQDIATPDIRIFVRYFEPQTDQALAHSLGLNKGMIGIVNAFASRKRAGANNMIIAHEMLHTLGASDKYDLETALPIHPDGYAEPERNPLHPQRTAELMGGRIPIDAGYAQMPTSLRQVIVGPATAREIRWIKDK